MKVAKYLYEKFPDSQNVFNNITNSLNILEKNRMQILYPKINKYNVTRPMFRFVVYIQIVLWRILDMSEEILNCWENKHPSSAFVLLRSLYENSSVIYYANNKLEKLLNENNFHEIQNLIINLTYATRIAERIEDNVREQLQRIKDGVGDYSSEEEIRKVFTATNILTIIDEINKTLKYHRSDYDHLCEYSHPNYDGLMGLYGNFKNTFTIELSREKGISQTNVINFFSRFDISLDLFLRGYDGMAKKLNEINQLAIEDLKRSGRSTDLYENPINE